MNGDLVANKNVADQAGGVAQTDYYGAVRINGSLDAHNNSSGVGGVFNAGAGIIVTGSVNVTGNSAINGNSGVFYVFAAGATVSLATMTGNVVATDNFSDYGAGGVMARGNLIAGNAAGTVEFSRNWAGYDAAGNKSSSAGTGGAISTDAGTIALTGTTITFDANKASSSGGAVYGRNGMTVTGHLILTDNTALASGGAIMINGADITSTGSVTATGNTSIADGGAIFARTITLGANGAALKFSNNSSGYMNFDGTPSSTPVSTYSSGGALFSTQAITLKGATIELSSNKTANLGGGLYAAQSVTITGDVTANANNARTIGGVVYAGSGNIQVNGSVNAEGNSAGQTGGVFNAAYGNVIVSADLALKKNVTTTGNGGAIFASNAVTAGNASSTVTITENEAGASGGGISANSVTLNGSSIAITDNNAKTNGGAIFSTQAIMLNGATIDLSNNKAGNLGGALYAGQGVTMNGDLTANANNARMMGGAVYAGSGNIQVNGSVNAEGNRADGTGSVFNAANGNVLVSGDLVLSNNIATTSNSGFMETGGAIVAKNSVVAGNTSSTIAITKNTSGNSGGGIYANNIVLDGASITLSDNKAAIGGGAVFAISDVVIGNSSSVIKITGNSAVSGASGAIASTGATLTGSSITVSNNTAKFFGGAITAMAGDLVITATGDANFLDNVAGTNGGMAYAGGNVTLSISGGDMTFSGNRANGSSANAIWFDNSNKKAVATFDVAADNNITFFDPIENNAANGVMTVNKTGEGTVSFDGSKYSADSDRLSKMFANTNVSEGTFEVANEAVYGAFAADSATAMAATSFTSAEGTMVQGGRIGSIRADNVTLNGNVSIAGRQQDVRGVLNVDANNLTLGGGTVFFNTHLDDGSSRDTDLLVLDLHGSATSGQSFINVTNAGGSGAVTIGDGIKLVETNGSGTTSGAFMLGNRVAAGGFDYFLHQGGNGATGGDTNDQNWYLRSIDTNPPAPPAGCEETGTCPVPPVAPVAPTIRPEVVVSSAIQPLAIEYGYAMLGTLHDRVGESYASAKPVTEERVVYCKDASQNFRCVVRVPVSKDETRWASSGWARLMGDRGINKSDSFSKRGPNYDYTFGGIQAGLDLFANEQADGTLDKAGIYVGYGQISSDVSGPFGLNGVKMIGKAGSVDMDAYTVGGYWTHHSPSSWYTDAVVQGTWYSADAHSILNQNVKPDGFGILASLEGGYSFKLNNGWTIEPQAQVIYQNVSFGNAHDAYGQFSFDDGDSLRGRLGVRVTKSWNMADAGQEARLITGWLRANVWHEFMGKSTTSVSALNGGNTLSFNSALGGTWGEIGAGVTAQVTDKVNLFATGAYNRSLDNRGREGWDGRLGVTVKW